MKPDSGPKHSWTCELGMEKGEGYIELPRHSAFVRVDAVNVCRKTKLLPQQTVYLLCRSNHVISNYVPYRFKEVAFRVNFGCLQKRTKQVQPKFMPATDKFCKIRPGTERLDFCFVTEKGHEFKRGTISLTLSIGI